MAAAAPLLSIHIEPEKTQYLLGEPTRLTVVVRNLSDETLALSRTGYYAVAAPHQDVRFCTDRSAEWNQVDLPPSDSTLYFVYPSWTSSAGRDIRTFGRVGHYGIRVSCSARIRKWTNETSDDLPEVWSNEVQIEISKPRRREARVFDAIWKAHAVGDSYPRNSSLSPNASDDNLNTLRQIVATCGGSPAIAYAKYAVARILLYSMVGYPMTERRDLWEAVYELEGVESSCPGFRPDEVAYYLALAYLRSEQSHVDVGRSRRDAQRIMNGLLSARPELHNNREIELLANRVNETGEEIEVRLGMDKHDYVVGEPMLFRMSLVNLSKRTILIPGPRSLNSCGYIEVERPDGFRELWGRSSSTTGARPDDSVLLAPGDSVSVEPSYNLFAGPSNEWGFPRPSQRAFSVPGRYRVSAACGIPEYRWRLTGAGRLFLSRSTEVVIRQANDQEAEIVRTMNDATKGSVFGAYIRDQAEFDAVQNLIARFPRQPMTFYLRRLVTQSDWMLPRGMKADASPGLALLKSLEQESTGLRRRELQMRRLYACSNSQNSALAVANREAADSLINELERTDRSIWSNLGFVLPACRARLGEPGYMTAVEWWMYKMGKDGPQPPTWDQLWEVAATAPRRIEPMGPFQPRSTGKYKHHILR